MPLVSLAKSRLSRTTNLSDVFDTAENYLGRIRQRSPTTADLRVDGILQLYHLDGTEIRYDRGQARPIGSNHCRELAHSLLVPNPRRRTK